MQLPVTLRLKLSPTLAVALLLAHGLVVSGTMATVLTLPIKLAFLVLLVLSLAFNLWRHVFELPIRTLTLKADGELEVERSDGSSSAARVHPQTTVFPWLVALLLRIDSRTIALVLAPDALEREAHRQLRLWLRWKAKTTA